MHELNVNPRVPKIKHIRSKDNAGLMKALVIQYWDCLIKTWLTCSTSVIVLSSSSSSALGSRHWQRRTFSGFANYWTWLQWVSPRTANRRKGDQGGCCFQLAEMSNHSDLCLCFHLKRQNTIFIIVSEKVINSGTVKLWRCYFFLGSVTSHALSVCLYWALAIFFDYEVRAARVLVRVDLWLLPQPIGAAALPPLHIAGSNRLNKNKCK